MVLNDADRSPEFQARQSYVNDWILDRGRMLEGRPFPELGRFDSRLKALVADRVETWRTGRATARWYHEMYGDANREGWERTQDDLRETCATRRARPFLDHIGIDLRDASASSRQLFDDVPAIACARAWGER